MRYLNLIYYLIHSDLIMSIQNGLVLSKPLTDNTPKNRSSKMGQLREEICHDSGMFIFNHDGV